MFGKLKLSQEMIKFIVEAIGAVIIVVFHLLQKQLKINFVTICRK